jgi:hypothetical protein
MAHHHAPAHTAAGLHSQARRGGAGRRRAGFPRRRQLAKQGFLRRKRSADDNREILLTLTKRGQKLGQEMWLASLDRNDELLAGYSAEKIRALVNTLDELVERAQLMLQSDESQLDR